MKQKKLIIISAVVLVFLVAVFAIVYTQLKPETQEGDKTITVTIVKAEGAERSFDINTDAEYLRAAIDEFDPALLQGSESEYGLFMQTVDGVTADDGAQEWWCLTKDGGEVFTGIDATPIADGDKFEITLTVGW
jgi:hypothetical protein